MKWRLGFLFLLACQSRIETASVGISVKGLTAIDDTVGFAREDIARMTLNITCTDGQSATITGNRSNDDRFIFMGAPVCGSAVLTLTITRATPTGGVTAIIGSAQATIHSPGVDVVFKARRFGELVVSYESGSRECTITSFEETPHRHAAETITVTAAPNSPSIALQAGAYTVTCGDATWLATVPFAERLVTTQPSQQPPALPNDATLSALTLSQGVLEPTFVNTTFDYVLRIAPNNFSVMLTATAANPKATIKVGSSVGTGTLTTEASGQDTPFAFTIEVTSEDGTETRVYAVEAQTMSSDTALTSLAIAPGLLTPSFVSGTNAYTVDVPDAVRSLEITASANPRATLRINNMPVLSGAATSVALTSTTNTIAITVVAESGATDTYTITARRGLLSSLTTMAGTLVPAFAPVVRRYTASTLSPGTTTVNATAVSANVVITINGVTGSTGVVVLNALNPNVNAAVVKATTPDNLSEEYWVSFDVGLVVDTLVMAGAGPTGNVRGYIVGSQGALTSGTAPMPAAGNISSLVSNAGGGQYFSAGLASGANPFRSFFMQIDGGVTQTVGATATAPYHSLTFAPKGTRAFVHNGAQQITYFNVDESTATTSAVANVTLSAPSAITSQAVGLAGRSLYVATNSTIYRFTNVSTTLMRATDTIAHAGTTELIAHPSGASLLAIAGQTVTTFLIDRVTGHLSSPQTTTLSATISSFAISRSGFFAAAAHATSTLSFLTMNEEGRVVSSSTHPTRNGDPAHLVAFELREPSLLLYTAENAGAEDFLRGYQVDTNGTLVNPMTDILSPSTASPYAPPAAIRFLIPHLDYRSPS